MSLSEFSTITAPPSDQNIEIKASINSEEDFQNKLKKAKDLTRSNGEIIQQKDIFFHSKTGRLKLRYEIGRPTQLIYYQRSNISGPKLSNYNKIIVEQPEILEKLLEESNGKFGIVEKKRHLFLYEDCRIHLDEVDNLGYFLEFEVVLKPNNLTIEEGQQVANEMMQIFDIEENQLLKGAYIDELLFKSK